jgi:hypothetical protein
MSIRIIHTDKSGLQWITPNAINTPKEAMDYIQWMHKRFGSVPFTLTINDVITYERKDHNQPSIIYLN